MSKRINIYIRDSTHKMLKDYCNIEELDMSRAVDDILQFRLKYLEEERAKALKKAKKEQTAEEWFEDYWDQAKKNYENNKKI